MKRQRFQFGLTLMEMITVITVVAVLALIAIPAIKTLVDNQGTADSTRTVISSALGSARAIAAREQRYAGIRFQNRYGTDEQYIIFIVYDDEIPNLVTGNLGCRAVEDIEPIKLPLNVRVIRHVINDAEIDDNPAPPPGGMTELETAKQFSILFSPAGKLVVNNLWVRNRDGVTNDSSYDNVFNTETNIVNNKIGMFLQDSLRDKSKSSFYIYDKDQLKKINSDRRFTDYFQYLKPVYLNSYTGTIINDR